MPFSNLGELKQEIQDWMDRTDIAGKSDDFVTLAEAGLNRKLSALEVDTTLTGTTDSRTIDLASLGVLVPLSLWMNDYGREIEILKLADGDFPVIETAGKPSIWASLNDDIVFDRPLGGAYSFRLHHTVKFDLVEDDDTNWLLTNHPDVYLAACIVWGAGFVDDNPKIARYSALLTDFINDVNRQERKKNKGTATVDAGLSSIGRRNYLRDVWPSQ